jgi:8-amino-7-oxononanoate synthase
MLGPEISFVDQDHVLWAGKPYLYLAGIDYHRMSRHPITVNAVAEGAHQYGINPTGSRMTTGNHPLYAQLEQAIAAFFATESALVCPSGYLSNTLLLQAIASDYDIFFIDEKAHSSLMDAAHQFNKPCFSFRHLDAQHLGEQLKQQLPAGSRPLVMTDGVFPAQGDIPPLKAYAQVIENDGGKILVDDAHAMAVLGETGRGSWEFRGIDRDLIYQTGTLSKGFGVFGGIIPGDSQLITDIHEKSPAFVGCTGLALPLAQAAICSIAHIQAHRHLITDLQERSLRLKQRFDAIGFPMPPTPVPIFSITHGDSGKNTKLKRLLLKNNIYPPFINYPGSPPGGHFRFIITSSTTDEQIDLLFDTVKLSL